MKLNNKKSVFSIPPSIRGVLGLSIVVLASCSRILLPNGDRNTPTNCFNQTWNAVDKNYSFLDYKNINWDSIRLAYGARVSDSMSQDSLFTVLNGMLGELRDGHVNLKTSYDYGRNWSWFQNYPDNFNQSFVNRQYLGKTFKRTGSMPNQILRDSVGYVEYRSFGAGISTDNLDYIFDRFKDCKAIVIDVRSNGGGSMANIFKIMGRIVDKKTLVGYYETRQSATRNTFSKKVPYYAEPAKGKTPFTKPVIVLTNRGCYSATTHFAGFMSVVPNVTLVGDRSGGGGGLPISSDLPNGWQLRFSGTRTTLPDGFNIEHGVPVDIETSTSAKDEIEGKDAIIEAAIEEGLKQFAIWKAKEDAKKEKKP
ncbi:MAG: hypothetical protein RL757_59 [Bacteroidota bacterium]|jgi:hypothetical protein